MPKPLPPRNQCTGCLAPAGTASWFRKNVEKGVKSEKGRFVKGVAYKLPASPMSWELITNYGILLQ